MSNQFESLEIWLRRVGDLALRDEFGDDQTATLAMFVVVAG